MDRTTKISAGITDAKKSSAIKGRGTHSNPPLRFSAQHAESVDDGWWQDDIESSGESDATEIIPVKSRTIISTNQSPDIPFERSINPYMGCEHGCVYCYARPSHAYWDMSPGLDFERKIFVKKDAPQRLKDALGKKKYTCKSLHIGANTDPYQPIEKKLEITRRLLEVLKTCQHPFSLITKSSMVLRDIELLEDMAQDNLCSVAISLTTMSRDLKRKLEPRTASPQSRLRVIEELARRDIPVSVFFAPVIPFVNDHEMEDILQRSATAGARSAQFVFLRLPLELSELMEQWLLEHYPDKARHVLSLVKQSRNGKTYDSTFGNRMRGEGAYAEMIHQRFSSACKKNGLSPEKDIPLSTHLFSPPNSQLQLI